MSDDRFIFHNDMKRPEKMGAIRGDNPDALAFYASLGFRIVGTAREHACVRGEYVDEVFTERIL